MVRHALTLASLLCFITLASAQASNITIERMPEQYATFWEGWQSSTPFISPVISQANSLRILEANGTEPRRLPLSPAEEEIFSEPIAGYSAARTKVREAQASMNELLTQFGTATASAAFFPFFPSLNTYYYFFLPRAKLTLSLSRDALTLSNKATNDAIELLLGRMEQLQHLGADEPGYGGAGSGPYSLMKDILAKSSDTSIKSQRYTDLASRYSATLAHAKDVDDAFYAGNTNFRDPHAFSNALNYQLSGSDSMLVLIASLYNASIYAERGMFDEYALALESADGRQEDCAASHSELSVAQKYAKIGDNILDAFEPAGRELFDSPATRLSRIPKTSECISGSKIKKAKALRNNEELDNYLSKSFLLLQQADLELVISTSEINGARYAANALLDNAPGVVSSAREAAASSISSFSAKTDAETIVLARAQKLMEDGDKFEAAASSSAATGDMLEAHYKALNKYNEAGLSISDSAVYDESKKQDAKSGTDALKNAIDAADADKVSTTYEEAQLALLQAQLKINDTALHSNIAETAAELSSSLFESARSQYSSLEREHDALSSDFDAMLDDMSPELQASYSQFLSLDSQYFESGRLLPSSLGHLAEIKSAFAGMRKAIEREKALAITNRLPKFHSLTLTPEGTPTLDAPSTFTIDLLLPNSMPLAVEGRTTLSIPFPYDVSESDITAKSSNILGIARTGGTLTILLDSIPANSISRITFRKAFTPAETSSSSERTLSLSPTLLRREVKIKFKSSFPLSSLRALISLPSSPSLLSAKLDGTSASTQLASTNASLSSEILMQGVSEGTHELLIYYEVPNPYNIRQSNRQVASTGGLNATISFDITLSSNGAQLEDVPIYIVEDGATTAKSASVIGASSQPLSLKIEPSSGGTAFSWKAQLLRPGEQLTYSVQYSVTDLQAYVGTIIPSSAENSPSSLSGKFSSSLSSFEEEERKYSAALSSLRSITSSSDASSFSRALETASSLKESAKILAAGGRYSEAFAVLASAHSTLSAIPLAKTFGTLRSQAYEGVQNAKADALKLSTFGDANDTLALLGSAEAQLSSSSASASSEAWQAAFSSLAGANSTLSSALSSLASAERAQIEKFNSAYSAYLAQKQNITRLISSLNSAITYTVGDAEVKKAKPDLPVDTVALSSSMSAAEKSASALSKKLDLSKPSTAIANARELQDALNALSDASSSELQLLSAYAGLERKANLSYENARLSLNQLAELAPADNKQLSDEISRLSGYLASSKSAFEAGRLLDSLSLSSTIQSRVLIALGRLPSKSSGGMPASDIAVIGLSLAFLGALVFMVSRRRQPPSNGTPHKLPSAAEEFLDM